MAYSYIDFNNLTQTQRDGVFSPSTLNYIDVSDIYVAVTDALSSVTTILTSSQFTVATSPSLTVTITDQALLPLDTLDTVRVGRNTDINALARTFADGSVLKASDLNSQNNQFLYSIQESLDTGSSSLPITADNKFDAGGRGIKNVGFPSGESDAATAAYVNSVLLYGAASPDPQAWQFVSSAADINNADRVYILQNPTPLSEIDNLYLVEIQGVLQRPTSDYTVTETSGVYTLRLIGAASSINNNVQVTVRNFGRVRNVLQDPFRAGTTTDSSVIIERIASQTGDLINARSETGTVLFRVSAAGAILIGAGAATETSNTFINPFQIEVGDVDTANNQKFGFFAGTSQAKAKVEIQGSTSAANNDIALQVIRGLNAGGTSQPFKVSYDGTLTHSSLVNASVNTSNIFCAGPVNVQGGHVDINNAYSLRIGTNEMNISRDTISGLDKIVLEPWNNAQSTEQSIGIKTVGAPGSIMLNNIGQTFIGIGGDGVGVPFGGQGSILFTKGGSSAYGPTMQWTTSGIRVLGFKVPTLQGGATGQLGNTPAYISYAQSEAVQAPLTVLLPEEIPCKQQIIDGIPAGYGMWKPNWSATGLADNAYHNVVISRVVVNYDPLNQFAYRDTGGPSGTQSGIYVTGGEWIVRARGRVRSRPGTSNTTYSITELKAKLQMGTSTAYQHFDEQSLKFNTTNYPNYTEADFDLTIKLIAGDPVLDVASLWILSNASLGSFVEIQVENCYISVEKVGP